MSPPTFSLKSLCLPRWQGEALQDHGLCFSSSSWGGCMGFWATLCPQHMVPRVVFIHETKKMVEVWSKLQGEGWGKVSVCE